MGPVHIRPERELRASVAAAVREHSRRIRVRLPGAEIEHVGSTSIPGALTKGDLDLLVRVDDAEFAAAVVELRELYAVHQPENWTPTYASFVDPTAADPPVGVQLAVRGSADDLLFAPFRQALIDDPALLRAYNELKRAYDGADYERYTDVKGAFVGAVLARVRACLQAR